LTNEPLVTHFVVEPRDSNHYGNVHGGVILHRADSHAYACALRFCRKLVVTAKVHEVDFIAPVKVGDLLTLSARVIRTGRTSLDIAVDISGEHLTSGEVFDVATAKFTMVAVDQNGKPTPLGCSLDSKENLC